MDERKNKSNLISDKEMDEFESNYNKKLEDEILDTSIGKKIKFFQKFNIGITMKNTIEKYIEENGQTMDSKGVFSLNLTSLNQIFSGQVYEANKNLGFDIMSIQDESQFTRMISDPEYRDAIIQNGVDYNSNTTPNFNIETNTNNKEQLSAVFKTPEFVEGLRDVLHQIPEIPEDMADNLINIIKQYEDPGKFLIDFNASLIAEESNLGTVEETSDKLSKYYTPEELEIISAEANKIHIEEGEPSEIVRKVLDIVEDLKQGKKLSSEDRLYIEIRNARKHFPELFEGHIVTESSIIKFADDYTETVARYDARKFAIDFDSEKYDPTNLVQMDNIYTIIKSITEMSNIPEYDIKLYTDFVKELQKLNLNIKLTKDGKFSQELLREFYEQNHPAYLEDSSQTPLEESNIEHKSSSISRIKSPKPIRIKFKADSIVSKSSLSNKNIYSFAEFVQKDKEKDIAAHRAALSPIMRQYLQKIVTPDNRLAINIYELIEVAKLTLINEQSEILNNTFINKSISNANLVEAFNKLDKDDESSLASMLKKVIIEHQELLADEFSDENHKCIDAEGNISLNFFYKADEYKAQNNITDTNKILKTLNKNKHNFNVKHNRYLTAVKGIEKKLEDEQVDINELYADLDDIDITVLSTDTLEKIKNHDPKKFDEKFGKDFKKLQSKSLIETKPGVLLNKIFNNTKRFFTVAKFRDDKTITSYYNQKLINAIISKPVNLVNKLFNKNYDKNNPYKGPFKGVKLQNEDFEYMRIDSEIRRYQKLINQMNRSRIHVLGNNYTTGPVISSIDLVTDENVKLFRDKEGSFYSKSEKYDLQDKLNALKEQRKELKFKRNLEFDHERKKQKIDKKKDKLGKKYKKLNAKPEKNKNKKQKLDDKREALQNKIKKDDERLNAIKKHGKNLDGSYNYIKNAKKYDEAKRKHKKNVEENQKNSNNNLNTISKDSKTQTEPNLLNKKRNDTSKEDINNNQYVKEEGLNRIKIDNSNSQIEKAALAQSNKQKETLSESEKNAYTNKTANKNSSAEDVNREY